MNEKTQTLLAEILFRVKRIEANNKIKETTLWRWSKVEHKTGVKKSYLHELINAGQFPRPVKLGSRARGFFAHEILDWILSRPRVGSPDGSNTDAQEVKSCT